MNQQLSNWTRQLGVIGLGLFALSSVFQTAPGHIGLALCLPSALSAAWDKRRQRMDTVTALALLIALWLLVRYALQVGWGVGDPALLKVRNVFVDWLFVPLFAVLALLPCADPLQRIRRLWLLSMLGFSLGIIGFLYRTGIGVLWSGERLGFHLERPLGIGLYAGCFLIALVTTWRQWWFAPPPWRWPARVAGIAFTALFAQVLIATQNRSTYLGAAIVIGVAGLSFAIRLVRGGAKGISARTIAVAGVAVALIAAVVATNFNAVATRLQAEHTIVSGVAAEGLAQAPTSSITIRLRLWQYALERFPDAPLIGQGFGEVGGVIRRDLVPRLAPDATSDGNLVYTQDHLHNSYLQTLWSQGLLGVMLWGALIVLLVRDATRAAKDNPACRALMPAMWGMLIFIAVWALTDYRLSHPDMRFFTLLSLLSLRLLGLGATDGRRRPDAEPGAAGSLA
ncbi:hypothetical protein GPA22_06210 [Aromatoleum toluvorans]|uniref:O-antigen ligase-related domain-containing protein n=1 Tax=Aromatoleum toluvorans TaxID=92002 RepID=A0ABX1PYJ2_9RHOO|nr:O-antigen ligase family protein [Aromatoleum toluvorans]NMG43325.1 hypothetical protein [Aromatoleum toluvorans]